MCKKLLRDSGSLNLSRKDREDVVTEIASKYNGSLCLSSINVAAKHVYTYDTGIIKKCTIDDSSVLIEYLIVADKKNDKYYVLYNASASLIQEEIGSDNEPSIANERFNVLDINNEWTINSYSISFELAIKVDSLYVAADIIKNDMIGEEIRTSLDNLYSDLFQIKK